MQTSLIEKGLVFCLVFVVMITGIEYLFDIHPSLTDSITINQKHSKDDKSKPIDTQFKQIWRDSDTGCLYGYIGGSSTVIYRNDGQPACPGSLPRETGNPLGPTGCVKVGTTPEAWLCVENKGRP